MQKEVLTREKIKYNCKAEFYTLFFNAIKLIIFCILVILFTFFWFSSLLSMPKLAWFLSSIFFLIIILIPIAVLIQYKQLRLIYNNKFNIVRDKLVSCQEKEIYHHPKLRIFSTPNTLHFKLYGKYLLFPEKYYKSSKYKMNDDGIVNTALIDDEFYLILVKNKIVYVYNTKLFELQE